MAKNFRAVERGFYDGMLVEPGATFSAHDEFNPNWAVGVDDHDTNALNSGQQESLPQSLEPVVPTLARADAPLPDFHPTFAAPTVESETGAAIQASDSGDGTPVVRTADTTSTSDPAKAAVKSSRKPGANAIDTGTAPAPAEVDAAKDASASESKAQDSLI